MNISSGRQINSTQGSAAGLKSKDKSGALNSSAKAADIWAENIHLASEHEDPEDAIILQRHNKMLGEHDKYIEYIRHVENAKQQMFRNHYEEMQALAAAGQKQSNHRYIELTYIVNENEEELE